MIQGLRITIGGEELRRLVDGRMRLHQQKVDALNARLEEHKDEMPFTVRPEDGFKTLDDLKNERDHYSGRVATLSLLRDHLIADESYVLGRADLQLAEMIAFEPVVDAEIASDIVAAERRSKPIDGLKLTFIGHGLRKLLDERIESHRQSVEWWEREQRRTPEEQTEEEPMLPDQMCEYEAERHDWRARVLEFIRDHVDPLEVYRLAESDLTFAELLPAKPGSVEQEDYEERTSVGFQLERLTKRLGELPLNTAVTPREVGTQPEVGQLS